MSRTTRNINKIKEDLQIIKWIKELIAFRKYASDDLIIKVANEINKDKVEQEYMSELCKGCSNVCSSCMVWKEHNGIGVD